MQVFCKLFSINFCLNTLSKNLIKYKHFIRFLQVFNQLFLSLFSVPLVHTAKRNIEPKLKERTNRQKRFINPRKVKRESIKY